MIIKKILLLSCLSLVSISATAGNNTNESTKSKFSPGYCQIEVINTSSYYATVYPTLNNRKQLPPLIVAAKSKDYVNLYDEEGCHPFAHLNIFGVNGVLIFNQDTVTNSTVYVIPKLKNQVQVHVKS